MKKTQLVCGRCGAQYWVYDNGGFTLAASYCLTCYNLLYSSPLCGRASFRYYANPPQCRSCGSHVEEDGSLCDSCREKRENEEACKEALEEFDQEFSRKHGDICVTHWPDDVHEDYNRGRERIKRRYGCD